jgi:hypothetical protein
VYRDDGAADLDSVRNVRVWCTGTMALLILFGLVGGLVYLRRNNLEFLFNRNTWCMLAIFFVLSMIR